LINPRVGKKNPPLIIVNPKKRRKKRVAKTINMKRNRLGQFVKGRAAAPKRNLPARRKRATVATRAARPRRRTAKRNPPIPWTAGAVGNRRRRQTPKRNPKLLGGLDRQGRLLGIPVPAASDVLYMTLGLGGPPIIKGITQRFIPTAWAVNQAAGWAVEGLSYAAPIGIGYMVGGTRAVRSVIAGEVAGLLVRVVARYTTPGYGRDFIGPMMQGYIKPGSAQGMRGYIKPGSGANLRGLPTLGNVGATSNRTRRTSRYL
jgi:hypothetical protein